MIVLFNTSAFKLLLFISRYIQYVLCIQSYLSYFQSQILDYEVCNQYIAFSLIM